MARTKKVGKEIKIAIIGLGRVGSTIAYSLLLRNIGSIIYVYEKDRKKLAGELSDLRHANYIFNRKKFPIKQGLLRNLKDCDVIIFTAGYSRASSKEKTEDLYSSNRAVILKYYSHLKNKIVLLVTNPTERLANEFYFIPISKALDNARLRTDRRSGGWVIDRKGYTNWGCSAEVLTTLQTFYKWNLHKLKM